MKLSQQKKEEDQKNFELDKWSFCHETNRFKKTYKFNSSHGKQSCCFAILLTELTSHEYKIFSDRKKDTRSVYIQFFNDFDDKKIDNILNLIDEAFKKALTYG